MLNLRMIYRISSQLGWLIQCLVPEDLAIFRSSTDCKMTMSEVDSFICKFGKLLHSGMNAQLEIKSEAGKALIKLTAEVDIAPRHETRSRNGPARQRRREKRSAAEDAAAVVTEEVVEQSEDNPVTGEALGVLEKSESNDLKDAVEATELEAVQTIEPEDEIVRDTMSDVRPEELASSVSIIPVRSVTGSDDAIGKVITEKLAGKGLKTLQVYVQRSMNGVFIRCDVRIQPILGKFIEETDFQFQNCKVIPIYGCQ